MRLYLTGPEKIVNGLSVPATRLAESGESNLTLGRFRGL